MHVPASNAVQQPSVHVCAVQMQRPPSQRVPCGQGPPVVPQTQAPFTHAFESGPHAAQMFPPVPHFDGVPLRHRPL